MADDRRGSSRVQLISAWVGIIGGVVAILAFFSNGQFLGTSAPGAPSTTIEAAPPAAGSAADRGADSGVGTATGADAEGAPEADLNDLPTGMVGSWRGSVDQDHPLAPYSVQIELSRGSLGDTVAEARYATLDCRTHWILARASSSSAVVREIVDSGNCIDVTISLELHGDQMDYSTDAARALLRRS